MVKHMGLEEGLRGLWNAGVALKSGEQVSADLVVDASGRGTHIPQWLRDADVPGVGEPEVVSSGITYASRRYKRPADWPEVCGPALCFLLSSLSLLGEGTLIHKGTHLYKAMQRQFCAVCCLIYFSSICWETRVFTSTCAPAPVQGHAETKLRCLFVQLDEQQLPYLSQIAYSQ
jgi:hypothetical protein